MSRILIVDDDVLQAQTLQRALRAERFVPSTVRDGNGALHALLRGSVDCVLLNDSPPGGDGFACCRSIRETSFVPIILFSPEADTSHKVRGLELGADDYLIAPFDPRELVARIRAILRSRGEYSATRKPAPIIIGDLVVDTVRHEASLSGQPLPLTHREYGILRHLAERAGEAVARDLLFEDVWGYDARLGGKLLEVYIRRVRRKIEPDPQNPAYLKTVRGFGYRLAEPKGVRNPECGMRNDE